MKFGLAFPNSYEGVYGSIPFASPAQLTEFAQIAEFLGYDSLWGLDLIVPSLTRRVEQNEAGMSGMTTIPTWFELLISLSYIASNTSKIKLGTGDIILPISEPDLLAKQLATLDNISKGRVLFGVGIGSSRVEFNSLYPRNKMFNRGLMMEEALEAIKLLLSGQMVSFSGQYYEFKDLCLTPRPVQSVIPVYISGNALNKPEKVAKRVAKWGNGWLISIATNNETIAKRMERLYPFMDDLGRDMSELDIAAVAVQSLASNETMGRQQYLNTRVSQRRIGGQSLDEFVARNLIGTSNEVVEKIMKLQDQGVTSCIVTNHAIDSYDELLEQIHRFSEEVMPYFPIENSKH